MSDRFIKMMDSSKTDELQEYFPNAFLLLCYIARRARRTLDGKYGLEPGDAIVGELESSRKSGLSKKAYRNALEKLEELGFIKTVFNPKNKKPQKRAIKRAIKSKVVQLCDDSIFDINREVRGEQMVDLRANWGRSEGDKQERKNEAECEESTSTSDDDFFSSLNDFNLSIKEKIKISKEFDEKLISKAAKAAKRGDNPTGLLIFFLRNPEKIKPSKNEQIEHNREYAKRIAKEVEGKIKKASIEVLSKEIEITSGTYAFVLKYDQPIAKFQGDLTIEVKRWIEAFQMI